MLLHSSMINCLLCYLLLFFINKLYISLIHPTNFIILIKLISSAILKPHKSNIQLFTMSQWQFPGFIFFSIFITIYLHCPTNGIYEQNNIFDFQTSSIYSIHNFEILKYTRLVTRFLFINKSCVWFTSEFYWIYTSKLIIMDIYEYWILSST